MRGKWSRMMSKLPYRRGHRRGGGGGSGGGVGDHLGRRLGCGRRRADLQQPLGEQPDMDDPKHARPGKQKKKKKSWSVSNFRAAEEEERFTKGTIVWLRVYTKQKEKKARKTRQRDSGGGAAMRGTVSVTPREGRRRGVTRKPFKFNRGLCRPTKDKC